MRVNACGRAAHREDSEGEQSSREDEPSRLTTMATGIAGRPHRSVGNDEATAGSRKPMTSILRCKQHSEEHVTPREAVARSAWLW